VGRCASFEQFIDFPPLEQPPVYVHCTRNIALKTSFLLQFYTLLPHPRFKSLYLEAFCLVLNAMATKSTPPAHEPISMEPDIVEVGGIEYLVGKESIGLINSHEFSGNSNSVIPVTACENRNVAGNARLATEMDKMILEDDVSIPEFTSHIICHTGRTIPDDQHVDKQGKPITFYQSQNALVPGPYFVKDNNVYRVSRLYPDDHVAFSCGVELDEGNDEPER
jgi:hypothetical protein